MRIHSTSAAIVLFTGVTLSAATVIRYETRAAFNSDTTSRTDLDFENIRNQCVNITDTGGINVGGININGGVTRGTRNGPCSPPLSLFRGWTISSRLLVRPTLPDQAVLTFTMPSGMNAVAFDVGVLEDGGIAAADVRATIVTTDGEQSFTVPVTGTGTGGAFRANPKFAGFLSSHPITAVRLSMVSRPDSDLIVDDFAYGQIAPPVITSTNGVVNGASFRAPVGPNSWMTIFGRLLSVPSRIWGGSDFAGNRLPTQIENVSVTINGRPTYVYYVNPGQLNVLTPVDLQEGPATVEVTRGGVKSAAVTVQVQRVAPGLFMFDPENRRYAVTTHADGTLVGKTSLYPGASTPARPGEIVTFWGTGFGRTDPAAPAGEIVSAAARLIAEPVVTIGGATAQVQFAGLTGSGLYQFNVRVPENLPDGDHAVVIRVEGASTQDNAFVTVQR